MALPKKKTSRSKKGMRRSHDHIARPNFIYCECGEATLPHRVCPDCGIYRGRQYLRSQQDDQS